MSSLQQNDQDITGLYSKVLAPIERTRAAVTKVTQRPEATLFIGERVVTLGYDLQQSTRLRPETAQRKLQLFTKKRPGYQPFQAVVTQSSSLSHMASNLQTAKSSVAFTLIFPASMFQSVMLEGPQKLPPYELVPMLEWLLQQQGFMPLSDWLWDWDNSRSANEGYPLLLIERATVELYLEKLSLKPSQVKAVIPALAHPDLTASAPHTCIPQGPWLHAEQAHWIASLLCNQGQNANKINLWRNLRDRIASRYLIASLQLFSTSIAIIMAGLLLFGVPFKSPPEHVAQGSLQGPPSLQPIQHPLLIHGALWQAILLPSEPPIQVEQLEYQRGRWSIQFSALQPEHGELWQSQLAKQLPGNWAFSLVSSQSVAEQTRFTMEVRQ